jgi:hypothetical protein
MTRSVRLYSVASHHLRPLSRQFLNDSHTPPLKESDPSSGELILLRWVMGLSSLLSDPTNLHEKLSKARLSWEVRCVTGSKVVTVSKRILSPSDCLPIGQRVQCAASVPCPPLYSTLEVWVSVVSSDVKIGSRMTTRSSDKSLKGRGRGREKERDYEVEGGLHVDSSHFEITRPEIYSQPERHIFVQADQSDLSPVDNALVSLYDPCEHQPFHLFHHQPPSFENPSLPEGFTIARHLRWCGQPAGQGRVEWKMKLSVSHGLRSESEGGGAGGEKNLLTMNRSKIVHEPLWTLNSSAAAAAGTQRGEESVPVPGQLLGYEWAVMRCRHDGVGSHLLDNCYDLLGHGTHLDHTDNLTDHPVETRVLDPWLWKPFSLPVESLMMNDAYLLLYRISGVGGKGAETGGGPMVSVSDWGLSLVGESFCGWEELLDDQLQGRILNGVWDDPSLQLAL